jgi:hypothetical protein
MPLDQHVEGGHGKGQRSYWIPGSYVPVLSEKRNSFSGLLKNRVVSLNTFAKTGAEVGRLKTV